MSSDTTTAAGVDASAGATLESLDPASLLIDGNIRRNTAVDQTLIDSVRDLGVLVPLVAVRTEEGVGSGSGTAAPWRPAPRSVPPCRCG